MRTVWERVKGWRNATTMRKQLSLVVGLAVALAMALLIIFHYQTQQRANTEQQTLALTRVLALETQRLDEYISELRTYSLQLRNDTAFMDLVTRETPLTYSQTQTVESSFKTFFYSRSDVGEMQLYLLRQDLKMTIDRQSLKVATTDGADASALPDYARVIAKPDFCSITPDESGFLVIARTIIDSPRDTPLAVVRFRVGLEVIRSMAASHVKQQEQLYMFDTAGRVFYPSGDDAKSDAKAVWQALTSAQQHMEIDNEAQLITDAGAGEYGFVLAVSKPIHVVNASLIAARNQAILLGCGLLLLTVLLLLWSIHVLTEPLAGLAERLRRIGAGNFDPEADLEGSYEMMGLSKDVQHMSQGISELIESNYVAKLNERTAQLVALEAQTNPHFLFNTLQAISTEAIVQGRDGIYRMVTALAALLRYSVKGGNLATLQTEIDYVEKYLLLQKARFGERLVYELHVDDVLLSRLVPKLGVLSLVENSIVHGMRDDVDSIHLSLSCEVSGGNAVISVQDDGAGMSPEKLEELAAIIQDPSVIITRSIGLSNLASRLKLLYGAQARLTIQSEVSPPRQTRVTLIIPMEVLEDVSGTNRRR